MVLPAAFWILSASGQLPPLHTSAAYSKVGLISVSHNLIPESTDKPSIIAFLRIGSLALALAANLCLVVVHAKFCCKSTPRNLNILTTSNSCKPRKYRRVLPLQPKHIILLLLQFHLNLQLSL